MKTVLFRLIAVSLGLFISIVICEVTFRILEHRENSRSSYEGEGGRWLADGRWGWKPSPGKFRIITPEFEMSGYVNELYLNDAPYYAKKDGSRTRVLAVGDSHTYAYGVSSEQTWIKILETKLNSTLGENKFRTYNAAAIGYSMQQYLLRLIDQGPILKPHYVIVGLSYATDLYDLLPPERGGWIYGPGKARDYFDITSSGQLVERHWEPSPPGYPDSQVTTTAAKVRNGLEYLATFRYLRRSRLALFVGSRVKIRGSTLWPNMEVVLEKEISPQHQYQWQLFEALLRRIKLESDRQGAKLIVVGIPYLPQIYDEIWESTFGRNPKYSRTAAIERVARFSRREGIRYVDTLEAFRAKTTELGRWLHYRKDAHPTPEGHEVIADAIVKAQLIIPLNRSATHLERRESLEQTLLR